MRFKKTEAWQAIEQRLRKLKKTPTNMKKRNTQTMSGMPLMPLRMHLQHTVRAGKKRFDMLQLTFGRTGYT